MRALVLYCSDFTLTLLHTGRSLDHRNPTGAQCDDSARSGFLIVCCIDYTPPSFPYTSASFTHSHTLSLDSCCRPTDCKSSSPAGLSTLVYASFSDICGAWFGFGLGVGIGFTGTLLLARAPLFSPPSFHTLSLSPAFTSVWWSD
jgi:hypothetical protein